MLLIEDNVTLPQDYEIRRRYGNTRYPIQELGVGQSFLVDCSRIDAPKMKQRLQCAVAYYKNKEVCKDRDYFVDLWSGDDGRFGARVWRLHDNETLDEDDYTDVN